VDTVINYPFWERVQLEGLLLPIMIQEEKSKIFPELYTFLC